MMKTYEVRHKESNEQLGILMLPAEIEVKFNFQTRAWVLRDSEGFWFAIYSNVTLEELPEVKTLGAAC